MVGVMIDNAFIQLGLIVRLSREKSCPYLVKKRPIGRFHYISYTSLETDRFQGV